MTQPSQNKEAVSDKVGSAPGAYLKSIRLQQEIPVEYLQRQLGLSRTMFHALEKDDLKRLPSPVYVKGYLRRYAELVGVRAPPVLAAYQSLLEARGLVEAPPKEETPQRPYMVMAGAALAFFLATSVVFGAILAEPDALPQPEQTQRQGAVDETTAVQSPVATSENHLTMVFSTDSWVEVVDADEHILAVSLQREGTRLELEGQPPFAIALGHGPGVTVAYRGEVVAFESDPETFAAKILVGK